MSSTIKDSIQGILTRRFQATLQISRGFRELDFNDAQADNIRALPAASVEDLERLETGLRIVDEIIEAILDAAWDRSGDTTSPIPYKIVPEPPDGGITLIPLFTMEGIRQAAAAEAAR